MAMKKESYSNNVFGDMASRNENWTEIDTTFGLKADKTYVDNQDAALTAQLAETDQRIDAIITTPVPTGEIIAEEIIDARQGAGSLGANIADVKSKLAENVQQVNQNDFVTEISKNINLPLATVAIDYGSPQRAFRLIQPVSSTKGFAHVFQKNAYDDYIMYLDAHIGNVAKSELTTLTKNYDSETGTWVKTYMPSYYTTVIGTTFAFAFNGTGFSFNHYADNRGGIWEFVTKDKLGNIISTVEKSTYSDVAASNTNQVVVSGLISDDYTVVATFKGDDPLHVPSGGVGTSRGWIVYETRVGYPVLSLTILDLFDTITKTDEVMYSYSNKEFALSCRPFGSDYAYNWIPQHNAIGTAFKVIDQQLIINGNLTSWNAFGKYIKNVQSMQLIQKVQGKSPEDGLALVEITTIHSYKNGVMSVTGKAKFLKKTDINTGYGIMCPYHVSFSKKMKSSLGNVYPTTLTDGTHTVLTNESDNANSFAFINDIDKTGYVLAVTVDTPFKTFRKGEVGVGTPFSWIEHRNTSMGKLYFQPFKDVTVDVGYTFNFSARFLVGIIPNISDLLL